MPAVKKFKPSQTSTHTYMTACVLHSKAHYTTYVVHTYQSTVPIAGQQQSSPYGVHTRVKVLCTEIFREPAADANSLVHKIC